MGLESHFPVWVGDWVGKRKQSPTTQKGGLLPPYVFNRYSISYSIPHCSAIAFAIPSYVFDRIFHLSGDGGNRCTFGSLPSTILVGTSLGKPLSHKQVAFVSP